MRRSVAEAAAELFAGLDLRPLADAVADGHLVPTGERVTAAQLLEALPELPVLHEVAQRVGVSSDGPTPRLAAAVELALESLYLSRRLAKDVDGVNTVYGP